MARTLLRMTRRRGKSAETYGYDVVSGFKIVGFVQMPPLVQYWQTESQHLLKAFQRKVMSIIEDEPCKHFSVFALAPQPLLIQLGALLTDKIDVETYQLHREPKGWVWQDCADDFDYIINKPDSFDGKPALIVSLSDHVSPERITRVIGEDGKLWEITLKDPHNDFMRANSNFLCSESA